jgi:hypothetical protein
MKKAWSSPTLSWANACAAHNTGQTMQATAIQQFQIFEEDITQLPSRFTFLIHN